MYTPFPVHEIEGSAHDCGEAHCRLAAERVQRTLDICLPSFVRQAGLSLADTRARAHLRAIDPGTPATASTATSARASGSSRRLVRSRSRT